MATYTFDKLSTRKMIQLAKVASREEGQIKAHQLLTELVGPDTLLALSGGTSVNYKEMIVGPGDIHPDDVCMIDDRYGMPFHENSNELLVKKSGLIEYLVSKKIRFTKCLEGKNIAQTEKDYDQKIRTLFAKYQDKVGVMGVAFNLHTGGIFPNSKALKSPAYVVSEIVDDIYPQRITITLKALGEFTGFLILMFGEEKKEALAKMLDPAENNIQSFPAIFYRKCRATAHLVTDITL